MTTATEHSFGNVFSMCSGRVYVCVETVVLRGHYINSLYEWREVCCGIISSTGAIGCHRELCYVVLNQMCIIIVMGGF